MVGEMEFFMQGTIEADPTFDEEYEVSTLRDESGIFFSIEVSCASASWET